MDEAQAGIKISRKDNNNLRYADDTTLMAASEEELKSLLMRVKEESEKAGLKLSIQLSLTVQFSHPYMTTGKIIALPRWTFVSKVMSLLFNTMSKFVIAFLPKSKCLNFMAAVTICSDFGA